MLTKEQEIKLTEYTDRWLAIGTDSSPSDRPRAERAVLALYEQEKQARPEIHWASSPDQAIQEIKTLFKEGPAWFFGPQAGHWLAFYQFVREVLGMIQETQDAVCLFELAQSCGWVSQHEGHVWLVERPRISLSVTGDLHSTTGPAMVYGQGKDEIREYFLESSPVPAAWIETPDQVDMRSVLLERNVSVRAAGIKHFGWGRILKAFPEHQVLDQDPRLHMGTLIQVDMPNAPRSRLLVATCPTGRDVAMMVPPTVNTALEAQAWINNSTQDQILALVART